MDTVFLTDLRIKTIIGIFEWERKVHQTVSIDLEIATDNRRAAKQDRIEDALDYKTVSKRVVEFVENSDFQLIETMAEGIAAIVTDEFSAPWVKVVVHKPGAIKAAKDVGVAIERGQR